MLDKRAIFSIHHHANQGYSTARIAELLCLDRKTVAKYLADPEPVRKKFLRTSQLDPYRVEIGEMLGRDARASAAVILQRLQAKGYTGKITILRDYLATVRPKRQRAFIRFESAPGEHYGKKEIMLRCTSELWHFLVLEPGLFHIISLQ